MMEPLFTVMGEGSEKESEPPPELEDDPSSLSEKEIVEHKTAAMEHFIEALRDGKAASALKAFEALHGLDHAAWDKESEGSDEEG